MGCVAGAQTSQPRCPSPCARGGRLASPRTLVQRSAQQLRGAGEGGGEQRPGRKRPTRVPARRPEARWSPPAASPTASLRAAGGLVRRLLGTKMLVGTGSASPEGRLLQPLDPRTVVALGAPPTGPGVPGPGLRWERMRGAGL